MEKNVVKQSTIRKADPVSLLKQNAMLLVLVLVLRNTLIQILGVLMEESEEDFKVVNLLYLEVVLEVMIVQ